MDFPSQNNIQIKVQKISNFLMAYEKNFKNLLDEYALFSLLDELKMQFLCKACNKHIASESLTSVWKHSLLN